MLRSYILFIHRSQILYLAWEEGKPVLYCSHIYKILGPLGTIKVLSSTDNSLQGDFPAPSRDAGQGSIERIFFCLGPLLRAEQVGGKLQSALPFLPEPILTAHPGDGGGWCVASSCLAVEMSNV